MEMSGRLNTSAAAALPVGTNCDPLKEGAGWAPELVWIFWGKEKSLAP